MVESYLFGDVHALGRAGVPNGRCPRLLDSDVERFETDDPAWLPVCQVENERKRRVLPWWCHERHPKHYLEHLTQDLYEETKQGKEALLGLAWASVPTMPSETPVLRCLLEDLSDWFCVKNPLGSGHLHPDLYPGKAVDRDKLLLRNI